MADYRALTRSNYFKVKNEADFRDWAESRRLEIWEREEGETGYFAMCSPDPDDGGWCTSLIDEETDEEVEVDIPLELSKHLQDGSVAVLVEVGSQRLRYLHGYATAINSRGEREMIDLWDIYKVGKRLGGEITTAEY